MGMDSVIVRTRQGERLSIATRDRVAFLAALSQATATPKPTSEFPPGRP